MEIKIQNTEIVLIEGNLTALVNYSREFNEISVEVLRKPEDEEDKPETIIKTTLDSSEELHNLGVLFEKIVSINENPETLINSYKNN